MLGCRKSSSPEEGYLQSFRIFPLNRKGFSHPAEEAATAAMGRQSAVEMRTQDGWQHLAHLAGMQNAAVLWPRLRLP